MEKILNDLITLTKLSDHDYEVLRNTAPQTQQWAEEIVTSFYETLFNYEPTACIFTAEERSDREAVLRRWYLEVTGGRLKRHFWQRLWLVGSVHLSRGVSNHLMLGMVSQVQQIFLTKCLQEFEPSQAEQVYQAFKRITDVVGGLISEGYLMNHRLETLEDQVKTHKHMEKLPLFLVQWMKAQESTAREEKTENKVHIKSY